jgi:hypothetical protein
MKTLARRLAVLAAGALLTACDQPLQPSTATPAARQGIAAATSNGADQYITEGVFDLEGTVAFISCNNGAQSDQVALEGKIYDRTTWLFDPTGAVHVTYHIMPVGMRGTSVITGEEYRVKENQTGVANQRETGYTGGFRWALSLVGTASGLSILVESQARYVVNANGELVVHRDESTITCK